MKTCPTCDTKFEPETGSHTYCRTACRELAPYFNNLKATIGRHEHEIVEVMSLAQLQRRKITDLNKTLSSVRCYVHQQHDPKIERVKELLDLQD